MSWPEDTPRLLYRWAVNSLALLVTSALVPGLKVTGPLAVLIAAGVFGIVNAVIRPVVILLTLPINLLSLGLFTFVINGLMLMLTAWLVPGFSVSGFWSAVWASILLALVSAFLTMVVPPRY